MFGWACGIIIISAIDLFMLFKLCDVVETRTTLSIDKNGVWALFKFLLPLYLVLYLIISLCLGLPTDQTNHALLRCGLEETQTQCAHLRQVPASPDA